MIKIWGTAFSLIGDLVMSLPQLNYYKYLKGIVLNTRGLDSSIDLAPNKKMKTEQTESPHYKIGFELSKVKYNLVDAKCYRFTIINYFNLFKKISQFIII